MELDRLKYAHIRFRADNGCIIFSCLAIALDVVQKEGIQRESLLNFIWGRGFIKDWEDQPEYVRQNQNVKHPKRIV